MDLRNYSNGSVTDKLYERAEGFGFALLSVGIASFGFYATLKAAEIVNSQQSQDSSLLLYTGLCAGALATCQLFKQTFSRGSELFLDHDLLSQHLKSKEEKDPTLLY